MIYGELMNYLIEIEVIKNQYKLSAEIVFALTILAISKVNGIDYDEFKKYVINKQTNGNKNE